MKKQNKLHIAVWILAMLPILITAVCYSSLPSQIPMHWDLAGHVSYGGKASLWGIAAMAPFFAALFMLLPKLDPRQRSYEKFAQPYLEFQISMMIFLIAMLGIILVESYRPGTVDISIAVCILVSSLFLVLGNMMPKFRQNFFCGIKTPWTISSEAVWRKTHRLGGRLFFGSGVIGLLACLLPPIARFVILMIAVAATVLIPMIMSYLWYQKESKSTHKMP